MEQLVLALVALGALCCMTTNMIMTAKLMSRGSKKTEELQKTEQELELERQRLEQQRLELEGIENINSYTGFLWKEGGKR